MKFLPKPTCEKLVKMGLKSESGLGWDQTDHVRGLPHDSPAGYALDEFGPYVPAFTLEDFVSTDEYAKENCQKLWPVGRYESGRPKWDINRTMIIYSKDWVEFISEAVEEYEKRKEK